MNHLPRQGKEKITAGVFVSVAVLATISKRIVCSSKSDLPIALRFHVICISQSNFKPFCNRTINSPYIYAPKHRTKN